MTLQLSQHEYWQLVQQAPSMAAAQSTTTALSTFEDVTWTYPTNLGEGYIRRMTLRQGLELEIGDYRLHDDLVMFNADRAHPLELAFVISGSEAVTAATVEAGHHSFCGSGMAPREILSTPARQRQVSINIHLEPTLFCQWLTGRADCPPKGFESWVKPYEQTYRLQVMPTPPAMQVVLQQILHCPLEGIPQRLYLETKVWELVALQLGGVSGDAHLSTSQPLRPSDIERIHYAREILESRLQQPPSLMELARLVGINDYKLKLGFRQVFGTTVFGYLQDLRMEQARQLLSAGEMNVTEAARAVGFSNRSYFATVFRRKFGVNPCTYRKSQRQDF